MTITEITRYYSITNYAYYNPYIIKSLPSMVPNTPQWWLDIGGADLSKTEIINLTDLLLIPTNNYERVYSYNDLISQDSAFYFNDTTQELFIHLPYNQAPTATYLYGATQGYSDNDTVIYVDDVLYLPLLKSIPSFSKQVDLAKYNKLAFLSGTHSFDNSNHDFDFIIDEDIYSNDIYDYYLPSIPDTYDYARTELIPLATFYVEDCKFALDEFTITAQDKRKSQDINILNTDETPLVYGLNKMRELKAIDDEISSPQYLVGKNMSDFGTVQVKGDYGWSDVLPYNMNLKDGTFNLSYIACRKGGEEFGTLFPVRIINFTGLVHTSALDVIVDLNKQVLGLEYTASNYDLIAWGDARATIHDISVVFDRQQKVYSAIQKIQSGSNVGFRYDITPEGKRTVILDDWNKSISRNIAWTEIKNNMTLPVTTDSSLVAGIVDLRYNNAIDKYINDSKYLETLTRYRTAPTYELETLINNESDAIQKSTQIIDRYSLIPRTAKIILHGVKFYDIKIFDIVTLDLSVENGRMYFGRWKVQILGIAPNTGTLENAISALLLERVTD